MPGAATEVTSVDVEAKSWSSEVSLNVSMVLHMLSVVSLLKRLTLAGNTFDGDRTHINRCLSSDFSRLHVSIISCLMSKNSSLPYAFELGFGDSTVCSGTTPPAPATFFDPQVRPVLTGGSAAK